MATLTPNAVQEILAGMVDLDPSVQVTSINAIQHGQSTNVKYRIELSDGVHTHPTLLPSQFNNLVVEEAMAIGSIVRLTEYTSKVFEKYTAIIINNLEMVLNKAPLIGTPTPLLQATSHFPRTSSHAPFGLQKNAISTEEPAIPASELLPIKSLTPYYKRWSIEGRAVTKSPIHEFHNANREGKVFGFDLIDKEGTEIHVTCFNELVDEFYNVVQSNSVYIISNGRVQVANKKFSSSMNPFEIFLHKSSTITPSLCVESTIPMQSLHIMSIDSLLSLPINSVVDVLGILLSISPASTIRKRDGSETVKCTATITDMSCLSIDVTLWGRHCEFEGKELNTMPLLPTPPIILIKSARITSWRGKALDTIFATTIVINPKNLEASTLHDWYATVGNETPFLSLSIDHLSSNKFSNPIDIATINNTNYPVKTNVCVKASITKVHLENFYYLSCPLMVGNKRCKKKVVENNPNSFHCPKCSIDLSRCDFSYMVKLDMDDGTGALVKVTAFEGPANTLFGVSAENFQLLLAGPDAAKEVLDQVLGHQFFFEVAITLNSFAGKEIQSFVITAIKPV